MKFLTLVITAFVSIFAVATLSYAKRADLEPYSKIQSRKIDEPSALVKSRTHTNTYWTHNDSGGKARIFAIDRNGATIPAHWENEDDYKGLSIGDAVNIDWEELATDDNGNLYIGAFGNNANLRKDLAIYKVREPNPREQNTTRTLQTIPFSYPDQKSFPPKLRNFDCEAFFCLNDKLYLLTKHRSDSNTKLYRLDSTKSHEVNELTYIDTFEIGGMVTAADASPDGSKIAVLTYKSVWIFTMPADSDNFLLGSASRLKIKAEHCESICWDDNETLILGNEEGDLFELKESQLSSYDPDE